MQKSTLIQFIITLIIFVILIVSAVLIIYFKTKDQKKDSDNMIDGKYMINPFIKTSEDIEGYINNPDYVINRGFSENRYVLSLNVDLKARK